MARKENCCARLLKGDLRHKCGGELTLDAPMGHRIFGCTKCDWKYEVENPNVIPIFHLYNKFVPDEWQDIHECTPFCDPEMYKRD